MAPSTDAAPPTDLAAFRDAFPLLRSTTWFATPSSAPAARPVVEAVEGALAEWSGGAASWQTLDRHAQHTRTRIAELLGVPSANVALLQSVAQAAATVARSLPAGSLVVVGEHEFRSNLAPWLAAERHGVRVRQVAMPDLYLSTEALTDAITPDVSLVAVSSVQSASGSRVDLTAVGTRCAEVGARLFVDATQSAGVLGLPDDVAPDFVAIHGYKWLLAPRGAAWLYVAEQHVASIDPLAANHRSGPHPWEEQYGGPLVHGTGASKLDASLGFLAWAGAAAALDLVGSLDADEVERACLRLASHARAMADSLGLRTAPTDLPSHVVSILAADTDAALASLERVGVRATARAGMVRLGFHAFNTEDEIEPALEAIRDAAS